jgi:hypothetical protein
MGSILLEKKARRFAAFHGEGCASDYDGIETRIGDLKLTVRDLVSWFPRSQRRDLGHPFLWRLRQREKQPQVLRLPSLRSGRSG